MKKNRREELISIAYKLFTTKGYENTSVDEMIAEAKIAKGTFYYYFISKEEILNEVIDKMISQESEYARQILLQPIPVEQKIIGIMGAFNPQGNEINIVNALNDESNLKMHSRVNKKVIAIAIPILKKVVLEGVEKHIFNCNNIEERLRIILILSNELFNSQNFNERDVEVFVDTVEKILGAKSGTMEFIKKLIGGYNE